MSRPGKTGAVRGIMWRQNSAARIHAFRNQAIRLRRDGRAEPVPDEVLQERCDGITRQVSPEVFCFATGNDSELGT